MTLVTRGIGLVGGLVAVVALTAGGTAPLAVGTAGVALLAVGGGRDGRRPVLLGAGCLFAALVVAGLNGAPPGLLVFGTVGAVVAWDGPSYAVGLRSQVGADAETGRAEAVHAGATLAAAATVGGVAYLTYLVGGGRFPPLAGTLVVLGAVLVAVGLERQG